MMRYSPDASTSLPSDHAGGVDAARPGGFGGRPFGGRPAVHRPAGWLERQRLVERFWLSQLRVKRLQLGVKRLRLIHAGLIVKRDHGVLVDVCDHGFRDADGHHSTDDR